MSNKPSSNVIPAKAAEHFAEIVESSLHMFVAQCWQWDKFPTFGELLLVDQDDYIAIGCVTHIQTGSPDGTRYPFPYQKTEAELRAEQPQIFEFLKTIFNVQILGYIEKTGKTEKIFYITPPKPCKIHSFVKKANAQMYKQFFARKDFLHILFAAGQQLNNLDELLLAIIKNISSHKLFEKSDLEAFCTTFSLLSGNDYRRLKLFLQRLQAVL